MAKDEIIANLNQENSYLKHQLEIHSNHDACNKIIN